MQPIRVGVAISFCVFLFGMAVATQAEDTAPAGWTTHSPREEIRPAFSYDFAGGPQGKGSYVISADERPGLFGWWQKTFEVEGGKHFEFSAVRLKAQISRHRPAVKQAYP